MASSRSTAFDTTFLLFAANYLLDGLLTVAGFWHGWAHDRNPLAAALSIRGIVSAKLLGLFSIIAAVYAASKFHPPVVRKLRWLFRAGTLFFSAVCVSNLVVLWSVSS